MMFTVMILLIVASFCCLIAAALGKCPLWVGTLILWVAVALTVIPLK